MATSRISCTSEEPTGESPSNFAKVEFAPDYSERWPVPWTVTLHAAVLGEFKPGSKYLITIEEITE